MKETDILITVFFITVVILLFITVIAITIFMAHRNKLKQEMKLAEARLTYANELRKAEAEVQEAVMEHIARELHDNVGSLITQARYKVNLIMLDGGEQERALKPLEDLLHRSGEQLRLLSRTLNKDFIMELGFRSALEMEITRLSQLGTLAIHWREDGEEPDINSDQQLMAFRIFQEVITNALKHADARNIYVSLAGKDKFVLEISDDGMGFNKEEMLASGKANGLRNMIKRAGMAGLTYEIESSAGKGCRTILSSGTESAG